MPPRADLLPGTLDLLVKAVSLGPLHGYAVLLRIEQITGGALLVEQGALYPGLFRLEHRSLLESWSRLAAAMTAALGTRAGEVT
jgi:PadR family transcriptional regulator, regulatory protein PadR